MEMSDRTRKGMEDRPGIRWGFHRLRNIRHIVSRTFTSIQAVFKCLPPSRKEINSNQFIQNFGECRKRIDDSLKFKSTRSGYLMQKMELARLEHLESPCFSRRWGRE